MFAGVNLGVADSPLQLRLQMCKRFVVTFSLEVVIQLGID